MYFSISEHELSEFPYRTQLAPHLWFQSYYPIEQNQKFGYQLGERVRKVGSRSSCQSCKKSKRFPGSRQLRRGCCWLQQYNHLGKAAYRGKCVHF